MKHIARIVYGSLAAMLVAVIFATFASAQTKQVTLAWDHDGVNTDGYITVVDGVRSAPTVGTCSGTAPRTCTALITLDTTKPSHTLSVIAFNAVYEVPSDPFTPAAPGKPGNVRVK